MNKDKRLFWIFGPSGAGKTHLVESIRAKRDDSAPASQILTFDLDFIGYRSKKGTFKEWIIDPAIFAILARNSTATGLPLVAVGNSSQPRRLFEAARGAGFVTIALVPDLDTLTQQRLQRGDVAEKVATGAADIAASLALAVDFEATVFDAAPGLMEFITPVCRLP